MAEDQIIEPDLVAAVLQATVNAHYDPEVTKMLLEQYVPGPLAAGCFIFHAAVLTGEVLRCCMPPTEGGTYGFQMVEPPPTEEQRLAAESALRSGFAAANEDYDTMAAVLQAVVLTGEPRALRLVVLAQIHFMHSIEHMTGQHPVFVP